MTDHHFISYSSADAFDFAFKLYNALVGGKPFIPAWRDKDKIKPGRDWDEQIVEGIKTCKSMIFVMTKDSIMPESVCKNEWTKALSYKKPVIPILLDKDAAEMPFGLGSRHNIDFTSNFDAGLAELRDHLIWLDSSEGKLQSLKDRLADAKRGLSRASVDKHTRIKDDIAQLQKDIENQQRIIDDPHAAINEVELRIKTEQEKERQPERPVSGISKTKFINPPPGAAPDYFQDRTVETQLIVDFIKNDMQRLIIVAGRGGMGKTAMVCRLLKSIENGKFPDEIEKINADGIVYLGESVTHRITVSNILTDLCKLLPDEKAKALDEKFMNPKISAADKMGYLLDAFPSGRTILLLDNFENFIDRKTGKIIDAELDEALRALLNLPQHSAKVIITTRSVSAELAYVHPERQKLLNLDTGLESPYAENILKKMDADDKLGLKKAPPELLLEARERTQGNPRALEHLYAILKNDSDTTLSKILADTKNLLPERVVDVLVGEAFSRLENTAQMVMEALSVYGRPVTPAGVDYMLSPFISGVNSAPVLGRLLNMHFVRKEEGRYYLHPVDRNYAFSRVPHGKTEDRENDEPAFTQFSLLHRGADYFEQVRKPREEWKTKDDLAPQLAEFDLRFAGEDYENAGRVLLDIDFHYLMLWGQYKMVIDMHRCLQGKISDPDMRGMSSVNLGAAYYYVGEYPEAIKYYEKAFDIAGENNNKGGEGSCLGNLGSAYSVLGQVQKAIEYYEKALAIATEIGDRRGEGTNIGNLGSAYSALGQVEKAIEYYEKALMIDREIGDRRIEGDHLGNLGLTYSDLGKVEKAIEYYEKALTIAKEIGDRRNENACLGNLGSAYGALGQVDKAIEYYEKALAIATEIGGRLNEGNHLGNLGSAYSALGQVEKAIEYYEKALAIDREIGDRRGEGTDLGNLGNAYRNLGQVEKAIEYYEKGLAIATEIGDKCGEGHQRMNLGYGYNLLNQTGKSIEYYQHALAIGKEIKDPRIINFCKEKLGIVPDMTA